MVKQLNVWLLPTKSVLKRGRGKLERHRGSRLFALRAEPLVPLGKTEAVVAKVKKRSSSKERQQQTKQAGKRPGRDSNGSGHAASFKYDKMDCTRSQF